MAYRAGALHLAACTVFLICGFLVFLSSSVLHFLHDGYDIAPELYEYLDNFDHFSIYLFIAGTYTPFLLNAVSAPWRLPLTVTIWMMALLGITYTTYRSKLPPFLRHRYVYTGLFIATGWVVLVRIQDILSSLSLLSLFFLAAGGFAYTVGAVIYATRRPRLVEGFFGYHELWHVMVLFGALFHYLLILSFYW